jgi:hypothetical protein
LEQQKKHINQKQIKMARIAKTVKPATEKVVKEKKVRTSYQQRKEARAPKETKVSYDWRKHLSPRHKEMLKHEELHAQFEPVYNDPEDHPEYLRASAAIEKDQIFAELDRWIALFPQALNQLKKEAGAIEPEDIMYHLNLISRILKNKYEEKVVVM